MIPVPVVVVGNISTVVDVMHKTEAVKNNLRIIIHLYCIFINLEV